MTIITQPTNERQAVAEADIDAQIDALAARAAAGEDVYADATSLGQKAREDKDMARWRIGDVAVVLDTRYGENSIGTFARDINESVASVKEYRTTCRFWTKSVRAEFLDIPVLTYSHLRTAKRLYAKFGMDGVRDFLYRAADNTWTTEQTRIEVKRLAGEPLPPKRLLDAEATCGSWDNTGHVSFYLAPGFDLLALDALERGLPVRIVVTEMSE